MGLEQKLSDILDIALADLVASGELAREVVAKTRYSVEPPRKGGSGDCATNVALVLAKPAGKNPRELAALVAERLRLAPLVAQVEVAGPGFINVTFEQAAFYALLREVLEAGDAYGRGRAATGQRVMVEFVSANPTGPLLISHGRGAVLGDVVARLLEVTGHLVTREYYINDFGNQVRLLSASVRAAARGEQPPEGGYGGFYVKELADSITARRPALLSDERNAELTRECILLMLEGIPGSELLGIRETLRKMGISFDVWTSEDGLHRWGKVERTLERLAARDRIATQEDGSVVFVTGGDDDKDRVVRKRDGDTTYFASDIAYHDDKYSRGFEHVIDVWGADHHGYVARVHAAMEALGHSPKQLEILLFQLVSLMRDGKPFRMGKRLGNLITIQEVLEEIDAAVGNPHAGRDAVRYFYLSRKQDTPITLDVELAKKQRSENPVFYIQYGHARLCSILRKAEDRFGLVVPRLTDALAARIQHPLELALVARLGRYPTVIVEAAEQRDPHKIVVYLEELAQAFQSYYTQLRQEGDSILPRDRECTDGWQARWDKDKTLARLAWVQAIRTVYSSGLALLGLEAPERMGQRDDEEEEVVAGA